LFPNFKKHIKKLNFQNNGDDTSAADDWFADQHSAFNLDGLKKVEQQRKKCAELRTEYVE
jgi:hypothetical protein